MKGLHDIDMQSFEDRCLSSSHKSFHFLCTFYSTASIPLDGSLTKSSSHIHVWMRSLSSYCVTREKKNNQNGSSKWLWSSHQGFLKFAPYIFLIILFSFNLVYFSWTLRMCLAMILRNVFRCFSIWMIKNFKR